MKNKHLAHQHRLSKWFLALFVCFGFFVFAGGLSNSQPGQHRAVQTELILNAVQKSNKKLVAYYHLFGSLNKIHFNGFTSFETIVLVNHHRSLQTKFKVLQQLYSSRATFYFSPLKTIPQSFKEEPQYFLLG
ncbi:hypothetical protein [Pedobacter sp. Hv1]|uniref:hypothetical protein n=1 Tax=Pedobacter sp. Hv1 TaxID=1740090 RepID=UPI0006D895C5|nr:hypothetical protein [Pedobacter sp. Hv1]KQB99747.1 hypothetical protein AQF98_14580 [Pedobacter sp. Hv1]